MKCYRMRIAADGGWVYFRDLDEIADETVRDGLAEYARKEDWKKSSSYPNYDGEHSSFQMVRKMIKDGRYR
jgi:hypothetical protein